MKQLLLVHLESGFVTTVERGRPEYYGVSWFPGTADLVLTHSNIDNETLVDEQSYRASIRGTLTKGDWQSPPFLSQPHQALCGSDGRVIVTNTGRNRITVIDTRGVQPLGEARISDAEWDRLGRDGPFADHLNSVFEKDGILYAVAHRFKAGSQLVRFAYPTLDLISVDPIPGATGVHNVMVTDAGEYIGCYSEISSLKNLVSGEVLWQSGGSAYTRGLAATSDHFFVGGSGLTSREGRSASDSTIWIVGRKDYRTVDCLWLGRFGSVHDIRLLDVPDEAHHRTPIEGGGELLLQRLTEARKSEAKQQFVSGLEDRSFWSGFAKPLGTAKTSDGGWKKAEDFFLCLLQAYSPCLAIDYEFEPGFEAYASLVVAYAGGDADASMDAFILYSSGREVSLQVWRHDRRSWNVDNPPLATSLPFSGVLKLHVNDKLATVVVGTTKEQFTTPLQNPPDKDTRLGIRAKQARFRPSYE